MAFNNIKNNVPMYLQKLVFWCNFGNMCKNNVFCCKSTKKVKAFFLHSPKACQLLPPWHKVWLVSTCSTIFSGNSFSRSPTSKMKLRFSGRVAYSPFSSSMYGESGVIVSKQLFHSWQRHWRAENNHWRPCRELHRSGWCPPRLWSHPGSFQQLQTQCTTERRIGLDFLERLLPELQEERSLPQKREDGV